MKNLGIMISLKAKAEQTEVVAKFLEDAVENVIKDDQVLTWYSYRIDKDTFGIFVTFNDEDGRGTHLNGLLDKVFKNKSEELLLQSPEITKIDIFTSK